MCGICGFLSKDEISPIVLKKMNDLMTFRGPDDSGEYISYRAKITSFLGFAQRRLSILDLSPKGHQPMFSASKETAIVFNGEIYNFQELRSKMPNYHFSSSTDTEVLLAGYETWGIDDLLKKIRGMFAFALYDFAKETLYLARDRMGEKPLYYYFDHENLIFSSTLSPIMACPKAHLKINKDVLPSFLLNTYIPSPFSIFENVYKVCPGQYGVVANGQIVLHQYWDAVERYKALSPNKYKKRSIAEKEISSLLASSVKEQLVADVPVGCLLSGGIDSSTVSAFAADQKNNLHTFSIGFEEKEYDESSYSSEVANFLGSAHKNQCFSEKDALQFLNDIPRYFDEPFADQSELPTMMVTELAKKDVTVTLSGDGGDEVFSGYSYYKNCKYLRFYQLLARASLPFCTSKSFRKKHKNFVKYVESFSRSDLKQYPSQIVHPQTEDILYEMVKTTKKEPIIFDKEKNFHIKNRRESRMLLDLTTYLPDCIMTKVDRSAMRSSLESRAPILDYRIVEASFRIPTNMEYHHGIGKQILRSICYKRIPKSMLNTKKHGFSAPIDKWLRNDLKDEIGRVSNEQYLCNQGIFEIEGVRRFIKLYNDHDPNIKASYVWSFLVFQKWYEYYRNLIIPDGSETHSEASSIGKVE
jgi:asparagine synthase (glutamine-hydrolysing)